MSKIFLTLIFCFISFVSFGQYSFSGSASGSVTIGTVINMSFTVNAGTVSFTGASQYQNGQTISNTVTVAIKSNLPWKLSFAAQSSLFTATGGGASTNMPASVAGLKASTSSTFITLSTTSQTLLNGNSGNASTSGNSFNIDMNINPGFSYKGGTYSLGVMYTLTNQ